LADEFEVTESDRFAPIVMVFVEVFVDITILFAGTIVRVSDGEPARIKELFEFIVANDCEFWM
jgi:hypothetical protein